MVHVYSTEFSLKVPCSSMNTDWPLWQLQYARLLRLARLHFACLQGTATQRCGSITWIILIRTIQSKPIVDNFIVGPFARVACYKNWGTTLGFRAKWSHWHIYCWTEMSEVVPPAAGPRPPGNEREGRSSPFSKSKQNENLKERLCLTHKSGTRFQVR